MNLLPLPTGSKSFPRLGGPFLEKEKNRKTLYRRGSRIQAGGGGSAATESKAEMTNKDAPFIRN